MKRLILIIVLVIAIFGNINAQNCEIEKITERILSCKCYYNEVHRAFYIISDEGLVLVDTYYYPWLTQESQNLVCKKIGRSDFKYLLHTHAHGCHVGGDWYYKNITIIEHDSAREHIDKLKNFHSKEYNKLKEEISTDSSKIKELKEYEMLVNIPYPTITFSDSFLLKLKDLTIEIKYFGNSGHSNDEALIYIPEEKTLIIGQIFGRSYFLPVVRESCSEYDLKRKIAVLSGFISKDLNHILSNHQGEIEMKDLVFARNYLQDLMTIVPKLVKENKDLNFIKNEFRLDTRYPDLASRHKISEDDLKNNESNIESVWKMIIAKAN